MSLYIYLYIEVDTGGKELKKVELFSSNITHNLGTMASKAGIYKQLWRPEEIGAKKAGDIIEAVEAGLNLMKENPERFEDLNTSNGWGTYEQFIPWIEKYLQALKEHPEAIIEVSR